MCQEFPLVGPRARLSRTCRRLVEAYVGVPLMGFVQCCSTAASYAEQKHVPRTGSLPGQKQMVEKLWLEFFSDPAQWWDNRSEKVNPRYPDFNRKKNRKALWLNSSLNPPWVEAEVAAMVPGGLQLDIFSWNRRLQKLVKAGSCEMAMEHFKQMQQEGMKPDRFSFVPILHACSKLRALEQGYLSCRDGWTALELSRQMEVEGVVPDPVTFLELLNACASLKTLEEGRHVHQQIIKRGYELDAFVGNCLVHMYAKCGCIEDARRVFNNMTVRDVIAWNAMLNGYVSCGEKQEALALFGQMQQEGVDPNPGTFVQLLNACASLVALEEGRRVHEQITKRGYESDVVVGSSLIHMYAKCGMVEDARHVFNKMPRRNVVAWNSMLMGYVNCEKEQEAWELYRLMQLDGEDPDPVTFVGLLKACARTKALQEGRYVHEQIIKKGYEADVFLCNCLVVMYAKCGNIKDARQVFNAMPTRTLVTWNAMLLGYARSRAGHEALELYKQMEREEVDPDIVTYLGLLNACANIEALAEGKRIHEQIIRRHYELDVFVGSSLIDMYAKCGSPEYAEKVFYEMPTKNVVTWNAMLLGYVKCGDAEKALELSQRMQLEKVNPNSVTFIGILNACAILLALEEGKHAHEQIIKSGYESDVLVGSSLVDMYAKCGSIEDAKLVFNKMGRRGLGVWNAMLAGYGSHGHALEALEHFNQMLDLVQVDGTSFSSLLSACSHAGLVDEGLHYFESMISAYNISPTVNHHTCVVDLLGRAGRLHEAEDLIRTMPFKQGALMWMSLLGACGIHRNVMMGESAVKPLMELDSENAASYVLLSNLYAAAGKGDTSAIVHKERLRCLETSRADLNSLEQGTLVGGEDDQYESSNRCHPCKAEEVG